MIKYFFSLLNWNKSIRVRIVGGSFLSFFLTAMISFVYGNYISFEPGYLDQVISLLLFFGLFMFLFFLFMRRDVRYLRSMGECLMSIAQGNLSHRVPIRKQDELGIVASNINYMADQLQSMMENERRIEKSKMELITNVSHDLRTPLTSIAGYLNLLKHDDYQNIEEHKRYITNAFNKTQQLKKLIDDLFEYTRLTSGSVQLIKSTVDLSSLLEQMLNEFEPIAQEQGLSINVVREPMPIYGDVDAEMLVRAIDNLLINALKFSYNPGEITVRLSIWEDQIYLAVENVGQPLTEEQERRLFERFYKVESSRHDSDTAQGAGLGLSIAQNIIELHNGRLGLGHQNGHFTFYIELPRNQTSLQDGSILQAID
ncbi:HAMP domain-containing sensor histidine kinase [Paenibacillus sp. 32352]|uniref:HAMP domain-containing sensor histidine kinase n=1 Tax=Paenibacillus sp. 32352 TaxID=1969111 RepID=UPI0021190FA0|nr:HAMP domain-containing sensor histidine kinase [Paenibacillus sp. 32352]